METPRSGLTGELLDGRYRVGAVIARGGMSTVYRGTDTRLERAVAIKVMSPQYAADPSFLSRFEREARIAAGLGHPGVVAVYDYGRDADAVFLVMELVDGGTLRDLLREYGSLSVPVTLSILEPLLAALGTAHAAGLVHRDIKPENILISAKREVKIADFGLVRAVGSHTVATGDVILGTVAYLSPEQVATGAADTRSDVYGAGIVAWEMLTGRAPFAGDNAMSVAYQHVHSDVPPVSVGAPGVPEALEDLIDAATRRDPLARPRDAAAFLSAVVGVRAGLGLSRVPVPVPHREPQGAVERPRTGGPRPAATGRPIGRDRRPPGAQPAALAAPDSEQEWGRTAARSATATDDDLSTAGGLGGPTGTRAVPVARAQTRSQTRGDARPARRRWVGRLVLFLVLLLLAIAAAVGGWWLGSGRFAYAPTLVGLTRTAAEQQVRDAGLVPQIHEAGDDSAAAGTVARAEPGPGTKLLRGSQVQVVVSTGLPTVPSIRPGSTPAQATAELADHQLKAATSHRTEYHDSIGAGLVIGTAPTAGQRVRVGSTVQLVVSKGPAPVRVPRVIGKSVEDARNKLIVDGFEVAGVRTVFDALAESGTVAGTDPAGGTTVPRGSPVTVLVATSITVPDLRNSSADAAVDALSDAGFSPVVAEPEFDADVAAGAVIRTVPAAGSKVDPASADITVVVSDAVLVPDLEGLTVGTARGTVEGLGLQLDDRSLFGGDWAPVLVQYPDRGTRVPPGSTIVVQAWG